METIRISVRNLVEFILRSGDIDNRRGTLAEKEAMQMGSRLHRKIQGQMGAAYRAEVPLKREIDCDTFLLSVEGRADGIFTEKESVWIDEIKGVFRDLSRLEEAVPVHLAQAKCYAYLYGEEQGLERIGVQMTYANLDTEEVRRFRREFDLEELRLWFEDLTGQYRKWAEFQIEWRKIRQASIGATVFPYPYREGQKSLAAAVYRTVQRQKKLFIQAPTGVGKTIAAVFPAVKAVGEGLGEKIFYLTAKTITRTVAQEAFSLLKEQGLRYKVITLTAKEKICMCPEPDCNPEKCPYARGHYDRINDAVFELLTGWGSTQEHAEVSGVNDSYTREALIAHAEKWQVCPFELSLDMSLWVDAVICDYNYVFDPQAKLKRFFADGVKGDYIFLIDEAHNLVERGREMYSASLYKEDFLEIKRLLAPVSAQAARALEKCNRYLLEMKRECESYELLKDIGLFAISLMNAASRLEALLEEDKSPLNRLEQQDLNDGDGEALRKKVLDFYFQVRNFLSIYEELDDSYEIYTQHTPEGRFKLKLFCIDTAGKIGNCLAKARGTVLFSATLLPVRYYMKLLSGTEEDYAVYAQSPFDPAQKKILIACDVSSRYTRRNAREYQKIAAYILEMAKARQGNYLAFFPSYKMLEEVRESFEELAPGNVRVLSQSSHMSEQEREEFLAEFSEDQSGSLVGFCVLGGIFGEGIDLKKERLIGAAVVGTGLPQLCEEREILKQYYDRRDMDGFAYAYQYPGMNKVLQSAGRVIRTSQDRGVILLLDERFFHSRYREIFPREWADYERCSLSDVQGKLKNFWNRFA
ncbi:MAG: helicase C-terminal domain-containing protein [Eubacteriales bacterium]|nr:helicase C-terminal domain-containing protein [Eubacteriales bacterium]